MGRTTFRFRRTRGALSAAAVIVAVALAAAPAMKGASPIDPDAENILRSMSKYMSGLAAYSAKAEVDTEVIDMDGQKLQLASSGSFLLSRPGSFYSQRQTPYGSFDLFIDGKTVTIYSKTRGVYYQLAAPGSLDHAITTLGEETGFELAGADLLYSDPLPGLMTDVTSGQYIGTTSVNGVECHHLAFRASKVDWQIWIQTGDKPLPMKYVITTKWMTAAPEFSVLLRDWDTQPKIPAGRFDFTPPAGAKRIETLRLSATGEVEIGEEKP